MRYDEEQDRPQVDRALLTRVLAYGRPYRADLIVVLVTILIVSLLTLVPPLLMRELIDRALPDKDLRLLTVLGIGMVAVPIVNTVVGTLQRWMSARAGEGIIFDLRRQLYRHLQGMSLRFFTSTRTGELVSRLNNDVVGAQNAITGTFITIASNIVTVTAILIVMVRTEWRLTLLAVAALPLFIYPARRVGRILRRVSQQQMEHNANMSSILTETFNVSGALLVKLFNRADDETEKFTEEAGLVRDLGVRRAVIGRWFFAALGVVSALGTAAVFWVGGVLVINDSFTVGTIVMFATLLAQLYSPLTALSNARVEFATSMVSFERVFEVLDLPHDIDEPTDAIRLTEIDGEVAFEHVSFKYVTDEPLPGLSEVKRMHWGRAVEQHGPETAQVSTREWALEDASFTIRPGQLAALVGPSGAGKTTISYLVPRLYDVNEGAVRIDGHDVRDLSLGTLGDGIGVVTQESYLFHDTIGANLRYAKPDATLEELEAACQAANIGNLIASLPDGFETMVGERGYRLSGGEKQRVAIARVILKDPRILILDEATSHLDSRSEALIQEALERVMEGRTSLVIAHRLSTILAADVILVLDQGRLIELGSHSELLERGGLYASLYETQFRNQPVEV
ncbi:MAG: ABC transporter ATP-binding protein [Acidimicrobiia bacterium]